MIIEIDSVMVHCGDAPSLPACPPDLTLFNIFWIFSCRCWALDYKNSDVRVFLPWILVIGVFIGLNHKLIGKAPCEVAARMPCAAECGSLHDDHPPCDESHDQNCPAEHHHHAACCHTPPSTAEFDFYRRLVPPSSYFVGVALVSDIIPDGPHLSSDRPPLI